MEGTQSKQCVKRDNLIQFLKFLCVGASNAAISYITYVIVISLGGHYVLGTTLGFITSVFSSYLISSHFVFKKSGSEERVWWKVLLKTYVSYTFTSLLLSNLFLFFMLDVIDISRFLHPCVALIGKLGFEISDVKLAELLAPIVNMAIFTPINFIINKFWAYRTKKVAESAQ